MKHKIFIYSFLLIFLLSGLNFAQEESDLEKLFPDTSVMAGHKLLSKIKSYPGRKLFDLINGGGEVYFEYGYKNVASARYAKGESGITIQFYEMENPDAAFGIYTFNRNPDDTIQQFEGINELNVQPNGVSFYINKYYIKIESFDEGAAIVKLIKSIAANMIKKIRTKYPEKKTVNIPLPKTGKKSNTLKVLAGNITAGAGDYFYQGNPLKFGKNKVAFFAKYFHRMSGADTIEFGIAAIKKEQCKESKALYLIGNKLHGSKENALTNSFYFDNLPILGFKKDNNRYFIYRGNEYIYIFSMINEKEFLKAIKFVEMNKAEFK